MNKLLEAGCWSISILLTVLSLVIILYVPEYLWFAILFAILSAIIIVIILNYNKQIKEEVKLSSRKLIKTFTYGGRYCAVIEIDWMKGLTEKEQREIPASLKDSMKPYCNGYVQIKESEKKKSDYDYDITADEITYQGDLSGMRVFEFGPDVTFIGFDSNHSWNDMKPESKTAKYVEETCRKIVDELNNPPKIKSNPKKLWRTKCK